MAVQQENTSEAVIERQSRESWTWLLQRCDEDEPGTDSELKWEDVSSVLRSHIPPHHSYEDKFELFAVAWPGNISQHMLLVPSSDTSKIYLGKRCLGSGPKSIGTEIDFVALVDDCRKRGKNGLCLLVVLEREYKIDEHAVCLYVCLATQTIDCYNPYFSPVRSDLALGRWCCDALPGFTYRSKSLRPRALCVQSMRGGPGLIGYRFRFQSCDRFCEMYCLLYALERMQGHDDTVACSRLVAMTKDQLVDKACSVWRHVRTTVAAYKGEIQTSG